MSALSDRLREAVSTQDILAVALDDAIRRGEQHFTLPPSDRELSDWAASLKTSAPHFFPPPVPAASGATDVPPGVPEAVWRGMSASSKLTWARTHQPPPVVERRPQYRLATGAELAAWKEQGLSTAEQLTAYRQQCQEQG